MFNDTFRNALKGNNDDAPCGYLQGNNHNIYYIISGILACASSTFQKWAKSPVQCITYNSAHDNLTLWDKNFRDISPEAFARLKNKIKELGVFFEVFF